MEHDIDWNKLRAPTVESGPHTLHSLDCLDDLKTGDHIEIQWKREREHPYDKVVLEFRQYDPGSPRRETTIWRKNHREIYKVLVISIILIFYASKDKNMLLMLYSTCLINMYKYIVLHF